MKIGLVLGSIRDHRKGASVAAWAESVASQRSDATYEVIDICDFALPLLADETLPAMRNKHYDDPRVQAFADRMDSCDAYLFITAEYNHGIPGAFKNAIDLLGSELNGKAVAFISYGAAMGSRAVEQWRLVVANFNMFDIRPQVMFSIFTDFNGNELVPSQRAVDSLNETLDVLVPIAGKLAA